MYLCRYKKAMEPNEQITKSEDAGLRLGIALTGGGARGFAHAGALAAIEEAGHRPDILAGVSAGSIVAVLYAAGISPKNFLDLFSQESFTKLVNFRPHNGGFFSMAPFKKFIVKNL